MPTFTELVAEIQSSDWDKGKEVATELAKIYQDLESTKQESIKGLEKQAKTILALVSAEGDDFAEKLTDASKKVAAQEEKISQLSKDLEASKLSISEFQHNQLLTQAKEKSGVNINVLKTLLSESDKLEVSGDKVTVNGKEIKDWAKTEKIDFLSALFPSTNTSNLPEGGSEGDTQLPEGGSEGDKPPKPLDLPLALRSDLKTIQKSVNHW